MGFIFIFFIGVILVMSGEPSGWIEIVLVVIVFGFGMFLGRSPKKKDSTDLDDSESSSLII